MFYEDHLRFSWVFMWIFHIFFYVRILQGLLGQVTRVPWSGSTPATSRRCRARRRWSARWRPQWISGTDAWGTTSIRALELGWNSGNDGFDDVFMVGACSFPWCEDSSERLRQFNPIDQLAGSTLCFIFDSGLIVILIHGDPEAESTNTPYSSYSSFSPAKLRQLTCFYQGVNRNTDAPNGGLNQRKPGRTRPQ